MKNGISVCNFVFSVFDYSSHLKLNCSVRGELIAFILFVLVIVFLGKSRELTLGGLKQAAKLGMFNGQYLFVAFFLVYRK